MDCWTSPRSNAKSKPGIQWVYLVTLTKVRVSVSALRWLRCLLTMARHQPVLNTTQWSTTWPKKGHLDYAYNQNAVPIMGYRKIKLDCTSVQRCAKSRPAAPPWYCVIRTGIWEEASGERGSFSRTRRIFNKVCFLFGVFYCTLEFSTVVFIFLALLRHQKHHISVITLNMYTFPLSGIMNCFEKCSRSLDNGSSWEWRSVFRACLSKEEFEREECCSAAEDGCDSIRRRSVRRM